jgi:hypothetical protein
MRWMLMTEIRMLLKINALQPRGKRNLGRPLNRWYENVPMWPNT